MTFWDRPTPALTDRRSSEAPLLYMDLGHITTVADMERRPAAAIYLVRPRALPPPAGPLSPGTAKGRGFFYGLPRPCHRRHDVVLHGREFLLSGSGGFGSS
jgi:hypothetical protein